jgi:hypothetical protein
MFARLADNQRETLEAFGVNLPDWIILRVLEGPPRGLRGEFSVNGSRFYVKWDLENGFEAGSDDVG